ncbi:P-loop NTPase fold protein, partial [Anabaena sp. WFMT]|uniref:P-loop NTPase fold protein n=1 Tax=Anabaena sp. WFMT TaxID=3449730 RepID=UPI003F280086
MTESTNKANAGVHREEAKSILDRFLNNENYRVLAVNGKWGIGKTYLVENFLSEHKKGYYYASVFGLSSIEQLKSQILSNFKRVSIDSQNTLTEPETRFGSVRKRLQNLVNWKNVDLEKINKTNLGNIKLDDLTLSLSGTGISLAVEVLRNIRFNQIKGSIVCIDDLERKSKLPLEEILGFVEYLVQELKCKIILIYNEDTLLKDPDNEKILKDYREKVIDREFTLYPTVDENLDFIFKDHSDIEVIKSVLINAGTNNIRVIRKTQWLIDELIPFMKNWEVSLRHQVIINIIIITVAKLDTDFCNRLFIDGIDP